MNSRRRLSRGYGVAVCAFCVLSSAWSLRSAFASEESAIANVMLKHLNLIDGEVEKTGQSQQCSAIRAKVASQRKSLKSSSDWLSVAQTSQYAALNQMRAAAKEQKCNDLNAKNSNGCRSVRNRLEQGADTLAKTAQWDQFVRSSTFQNLRESYAKAEKLDCVNAPTPHLQTPDDGG